MREGILRMRGDEGRVVSTAHVSIGSIPVVGYGGLCWKKWMRTPNCRSFLNSTPQFLISELQFFRNYVILAKNYKSSEKIY